MSVNEKPFKIGIVTHFHNSINYGGMLQAYALCRFINELDSSYYAEQITYDMQKNYDNIVPYVGEKLLTFIKLPINKKYEAVKQRVTCRFHREIISEEKQNIIQSYLDIRKKVFKEFENSIPHSEKIYNRVSIKETQSKYDAFITGSDQVWNMDWYRSTFFLDFVINGKPKFSYAASIGKDNLSLEQQMIIRNHLLTYTGVSVREEKALELIQNLSPISVEWVLDPTLLLTKNNWDLFCENEILHDKLIGLEFKYIFCYFLGDNINERLIAKDYAKNNDFRVVTIPYLNGKYIECDEKFGDIVLSDVNPKQLITIIKNAAYVFTDSFHATVISIIYQKEYFVFRRNNADQMCSRIDSLLSLFDSRHRFCNTVERENLEYINSLRPIDYTVEYPKFDELKKQSYSYIKRNLNVTE